MDVERFEQLLAGAVPTLDDYAGFVSFVEKLPGERLWKISCENVNLNGVLKKVVFKELQGKVAKQNTDGALNAIVAGLAAPR